MILLKNVNRRVLISLSVIGIVAAFAIGGTVAYFSDTETSVGNTFKAGKFNLLVDSTCEYNGKMCVDGYWGDTQESCACTWAEKDLAGELYFNLLDVKPGDNGEDTISLHVINNDSWMCAQIANLKNFDNNCEQPEIQSDTTCGDPGEGEGELQNYLKLTLWQDDNCNNILEGGEKILVDNLPISSNLWSLADASTGNGPFIGDKTYCVGTSWNVPIATGNIIQTDSVTADIRFVAVQARHMEDFTCASLFNEVCDGIDNDYNGKIDENWPTLGQTCSVGAGVCAATGVYTCDTSNPASPVVCSVTAGTAGTEICIDGLDNDCDGIIDTDCVCASNGDCNDSNPATFDTCNVQHLCEYAGTAVCGDGLINSIQGEVCDDANTVSGDGCSATCIIEVGFNCAGEPSVCTPILDICNGIDENGDGTDGENEPWLGQACDGADADMCKEGTFQCLAGVQTCSDISSDNVEVCDGIDNDCDGTIDEGVTTTYYRDSDNDTYGSPISFVQACSKPSSYVTNSNDCNDTNSSIKPGATEIVGDGIDQNCNGKETCYQDNDNDNYRTNFTMESFDTDCTDPGEALSFDMTGDCNDSNVSIHPWATEVCNGLDDDCDGAIDESFPEQWDTCGQIGPGAFLWYHCTAGVLSCP